MQETIIAAEQDQDGQAKARARDASVREHMEDAGFEVASALRRIAMAAWLLSDDGRLDMVAAAAEADRNWERWGSPITRDSVWEGLTILTEGGEWVNDFRDGHTMLGHFVEDGVECYWWHDDEPAGCGWSASKPEWWDERFDDFERNGNGSPEAAPPEDPRLDEATGERAENEPCQ
jgi:hypothetical protein